MKRFLDASVLVEACLAHGAGFAMANALVESPETVTSTHALAEVYATLSGDARLRIDPQDAAHMVLELASLLHVHPLKLKSYLTLVEMAPSRGILGGSFFDALHAQAAREAKCREIVTLNVRHFKHVAPDLVVRDLRAFDG